MNRKILNEIKSIKRRIVPNGRVFLFGSQARGDAHPDSDWDLLVLLNKDKISYEDENRYAYPFAEMGWAYGTYISVKLYTENEWQLRSITPFYHNVQKDGVEIL